jgi:OmpA-OmpF porin, OOP family
MASKKQSFLIAFMCLALSGMSQISTGGGSYNLYDSSLYPSKRLPQHNEFLGNNYAYPAKPRNQWEIGVKAGIFTVSGDVPVVVPTLGWGLHVRKSLGYLFSLRAEFISGVGKGLHWLEANNYQKNTAWTRTGYDANRLTRGPNVNPGTTDADVYFHSGRDKVYYNYKTSVQDLGLQGIMTLNNVRFHKRKTSAVIYGIAGIGASIYETKVNALGANNAKYNFNSIQSGQYTGRKQKLKDIKALLDNTYETPAETHDANGVQGGRRPKLFGKTLKPSGTVGVGFAFKINNRFNIALEDRHTFIKDDLLDGQRWQEHAAGDAVMTRDFDSYNMVSLGLNVNLGAKSVEPLWWQNPLDYAYSELPNRTLARFKYTPKDGDGDGVMDEMDKEPNTPAGCPVNTQGITADTDGDGVPDCKDKELITPTQCQPVDADGIGKCPEPECCKNGGGTGGTTACGFSAPAVEFTGSSCNLSASAKEALNTLANDMKSNATCNVTVTARGESKAMQKLADCRGNAIKKYLVSKGVTESRINTAVDQTQDSNTADIEVIGQ